MSPNETMEVAFKKPIMVKNQKVEKVTVRLPKVKDDLAASKMSRFQTPTGYMQVDELEKEVYMISAVTNIPRTDLDNLSRAEYAMLSDAVGKLEQTALLPPDTKSEESK